jgi:large subunit ribosomal protein L10
MSANFENKKVVVAEIEAYAKEAKSIVLVDYRGLTVAQANELRNDVRSAGGTYKVYKNRLMKIAFDKLGIAFPESDYEGTTAVLFHANDEVAPAKIALDGTKKFNKHLKLKSGFVNGKYFNTEEITAFANIPSREVLLAQLLGLLTNPMRSLAVAISEVAKKNA